MNLVFGSPSDCESALSSCQSSGGSAFLSDTNASSCDSSFLEGLGGACDASVSEFEACSEANLSAWVIRIQGWSRTMNPEDIDLSPLPLRMPGLEDKGCEL